MDWTKLLAGVLPAVIAELPNILKGTTATPASTQAVSGAPAASVQFIKLVQEALNAAQALGYVSFGAALAVDGIAGPKTTAAFEAVLAKLGVKV